MAIPDLPSQDHQPLTPAVLHIMLALSNGELHGYAIMQTIASQSHGEAKMGPGTLYGSIKRMIAAGLVTESPERPDPDRADVRRRYYQLTPLGESTLEAELQRLDRVLRLPAARRFVEAPRPS